MVHKEVNTFHLYIATCTTATKGVFIWGKFIAAKWGSQLNKISPYKRTLFLVIKSMFKLIFLKTVEMYLTKSVMKTDVKLMSFWPILSKK